MADDVGPTFDPGGEARSVLQSAVADFGVRVLSDPAIVDGICEDRLPEWPREASLISTAARADVADMLQQQAGGIGPDTAVRLTAGTLAESRSLDPAACVWVVGEFARALGYQVSDGLRPATANGAAPGGAAANGAATAGAGGAASRGTGGAAAGRVVGDAPDPVPGRPGDAVTALPPEPAPRSGGAPPGQDPTVPPASGPDRPASGHPADLGHSPTVTSAAPPVTGARPPGAGGGPPAPPGRPPVRPGGPNQKVLLAGGAAALLVLYFILAGATHLPPFSQASPTPAPSQSQPPTPAASPTSPSPPATPGLTATQRTLAALIPASVAADNSCRTVSRGNFGSVAEFDCAGAPSVSAGDVNYYLFRTQAALNHAYLVFLSSFAHSAENTGPCNQGTGSAAFRTFAPCETSYHVGNTSLGGRIMEYPYKGRPDISTTYGSKLVLVNMGGNNNGNNLLAFWDRISNWINR